MFSLERDNDTICAIATAPGVGAIAVVRVSGENALQIVKKCAPFLPTSPETHKLFFGLFCNLSVSQPIDEVLITYFARGKSYTGEETLEISCHGSPVIAQNILQALIVAGARLAEKGEFTYRAFSNGRIDLPQAEGVLSLIESQTTAAARQALRQLRGELSSNFSQIEENLVWALSRLEANIDFSAEDIEFATSEEIMSRLDSARAATQKLIDSHRIGRTLAAGLKVAIVGAPNVGKSSLLNAIVQFDRAIVSSVAGTTRDTIEADINLAGIKINFLDTAGLRETHDEIESLGIGRTKNAIEEADVVCFVFDLTDSTTWELPEALINLKKNLIFIGNKSDAVSDPEVFLNARRLAKDNFAGATVLVSATMGLEIESLKKALLSMADLQTNEGSAAIVHTRQFEQLNKMLPRIQEAARLHVEKASPEFIIAELNEAIFICLELVGRRFDDEVLDRVFKDFCLGK